MKKEREGREDLMVAQFESEAKAQVDPRQSTYGNFDSHSSLSQALKNTIMQHYFTVHGGDKAQPLPPYVVEAISIICYNLAGISNGNPACTSSWDSISDYADLVSKQLQTS